MRFSMKCPAVVMIYIMPVAALGCASVCLAGPVAALTTTAEQAILPVHEGLQRVRDAQARRGPPKDVSERLIRLGELDQAGRELLHTIDLSRLPTEERLPASSAMWQEINAQDADNQAALVALMPQDGWFTSDRYGEQASRAAWSVVQHATDNIPLMQMALARMTPAVQAHLVAPDGYGMLYDRVAMLQDRPQTYGTQFKCVDHHWQLYSLLDPAHVEDRRRALGMIETAASEAARIATYPPCYFKPGS